MTRNLIARALKSVLLATIAMLALTAGPSRAEDTVVRPAFTAQAFAAQGFSHHVAQIRGDLRMHYVVGGRGERGTVVLLHGWPETWYAWRWVLPRLTAAGYRVIAPDMRGSGATSKPEAGYAKANMAEDVEALLSSLGSERVLLVGQDWGGPVATALALAHPERVIKLVNIEGALAGTLPDDAAALRRGEGSWWFAFHNAPDGVAEMLVAGHERAYLSHMIRSMMVDTSAVSEADLDEYLRSYAGPNGTRGGFEYYRTYAVDSADTHAAMSHKLALPVLAVGGEQSLVGGASVEKSMRLVASNVHGALLPNCGHYAAEEQPEKLTALLIDFFSNDK